MRIFVYRCILRSSESRAFYEAAYSLPMASAAIRLMTWFNRHYHCSKGFKCASAASSVCLMEIGMLLGLNRDQETSVHSLQVVTIGDSVVFTEYLHLRPLYRLEKDVGNTINETRNSK